MTLDIARPLGEVFASYAKFTQVPPVFSDIVAVRRLEPGVTGWAIERPLGSHVHMGVKVIELRPNRLIRYRSCNRRRFSARGLVRFRPLGPSLTRVEEELLLPLGMIGRWSARSQDRRTS